MTPTILLEALRSYIADKTKDLMLPIRIRTGTGGETKERPPNVYLMNVPKKEDEIQQIPYILIKYLNGKDEQQGGSITQSEARVRIIIVTYSEDGQEGALALLNVLERIRHHLLKDREVGGQFRLIMPIETLAYPDNTAPYYLGEIMTLWTLPAIEQEVNLYD